MLFYVTLKGRFVLKILKLLSCLFDHVEKHVGYDKVNFEIYDVKTWKINNSRSKGNQAIKFGRLIQ